MTQQKSGQTHVLISVSLAFCFVLLGLSLSAAPVAQSSAMQVTIVPNASTLTTTAYSQDVITVVVGVNNTVVWNNHDNVIHTATGTNFTGFNTGDIKPGASASYTFNTAGTYPYHCIYHTGMVGTVIVRGSAVSAASSASSGGGGIPEFPYQLIATIILTALILTSYLLIRHSPHAPTITSRAIRSIATP